MAYLVNKTRAVSLLINGVSYLNSLIALTVSDESANKQGLISTTGSIVLRTYGTNPLLEDYDRDNFKRGQVVTFDVSIDGGAPVRHPRGYLYVLSTSYGADDDQLTVEVGCRLALAKLTDDASQLLYLAPIPLDPAQQTVSNIGASLASAGMYCFQNNQGNLQTGYFFENDNSSGIAAGEWTSIYGVTCLESQSLAGSAPIPDQINLSYQVPSDGLAEDESGKIDISEDESYYFVGYPAITFTRIKKEDENDPTPKPTPPIPKPVPPPPVSGCGTSPSVPSNNGPITFPPDVDREDQKESCSDEYESAQTTEYIGATRVEKSTTYYMGPGGQVSKQITESYAPLFEANSQYFSDQYTFCRYNYASQCIPNGGCPYLGTNNELLEKQETSYLYGDSGEVARVTVDNYKTRLSAAIPEDWRSGVKGGTQQTFRRISGETILYRDSRQETSYLYSGNTNIQTIKTWTSNASRGVGVKSARSLDALSGIVTTQRRFSTTISANALSPDIVNTVTTNTTERTSTILLYSNRYILPPTEAGPYIVDESIPVPLLFTNESQITDTVNRYSNYLEKFTKGDALGLVVTESLRADIVSSWRPGKPFRYYDPRNGKLMAFRMDACTWGLGANEAVVSTDGIWIGFSNGTVNIPSNLVGNSRPDMGGGTLPPPGPGLPPSVNGETAVDQGSFAWVVDVRIATNASIDMYGENGVKPIMPTDLNLGVSTIFTVWCTGFTATAGSVLATEPDGGFPLTAGGSLLTVDAVVIDADLFV